MVRHEAAEALGSMMGDQRAFKALSAGTEDNCQVVRESCLIGLDMWNWMGSNEYQYANGLEMTTSQ